MAITAAQVIDRLNRQWDDEATNLVTSHENFGEVARHVEDEASDSDSPILAEYIAGGGDDTLKGMTNFMAPELDALWALHFDTWQKHSIDFNIGVSTIEKLVHRVITTIEPVLYSQLVKPIKMSGQIESGNTFDNYPHALYATDVKFQPAYRPNGRYAEQKVYFSAKPKLYGFKIECSVAPPGLAVDVSDHAPGPSSDVTVMLDRLSIHRQMLRKEDGSVPEIGGEPTQFPEMWAILVDKGYQGAGRVLRTIQPKKKPRGGILDRDDLARNKAVSSGRVLVENFFGRMCMLWKATYAALKWNENLFDCAARLCTALSNFHVGLMPLRTRDSEHYDMVLSKYQSMGERVRTQRAQAQRHYLMWQQLRSRPAPYRARSSASQRETQYESDDSFSFSL
ncbi:unnamed protein product [Phytophthora fragariaefolia]|uniref:Unnamed protein product n=1 Tax=Phytophthora fragariaefolia TaxID=1490495 RepID=A0A9W6XYN1_9STRA|nr:unnamed protein product [Phytophthora fragariaefolia]